MDKVVRYLTAPTLEHMSEHGAGNGAGRGAGSSAGAVLLLASAVDLLAAAEPDLLAVGELQQLTGQVADLTARLTGVGVALLGALAVRSGGTVPADGGVRPADLGPQDDPDTGDAGADGAAAGAGGPRVLVRHWLRDRTGCGAPAAGAQVRLAHDLRELPLVLAAVLDGRLGIAQARVLTRLVGQIDPAALAEAEPDLIAVASERDPQALADWVRHLLATWCEPQFEHDQQTQERQRYLQTWRTPDGMLAGRFRLTTADAEAFLTVLEPLARPAGLADDRSAGQRRADALVEVCQQVLRFGDLPDAGGLRPQVSYVVPADWAAGHGPVGSFADLVGASLGAHPLGDLRARVPVEDSCPIGAWTGPQTRTLVETILCDARLTRVLLDTRGQVKSLQSLGDSITTTQRRALAARDHGCAVRGCTRPPAGCDAHHLDHRADGGATTIDNLVLLCRRHHTQWHQGRLTLRQLHVPWIDGRHDPPE